MPSQLESGHLEMALSQGEIELQGQFVLGYNYTFLANLSYQEQKFLAVYKPTRGEQPLWDFPPRSLAQREVAAYLVCRALGWDFVPVTVFRDQGPLGPGSLQQFVEYDPNYHYFIFSQADRQRLRPVVLFDLLVNNADRKGGHILVEKGTDHLYLIDHGLCFHEEDKLRTIIWDFAGEEVPEEQIFALTSFCEQLTGDSGLHSKLQALLSPGEVNALLVRAKAILSAQKYPSPPKDRRAYPYPPL